MVDLTQIAVAVIALIGTIITAFVVPVIKSKLSAAQREKLYTFTQIAVQAAEQLCRNGEIYPSERKDHVLQFLKNHGFTIDTDEVDELIESLVYELPPLIIKDEADDDEDEG